MSSTSARATFNPVDAYLRFRRAKILTVEPVLFLYMFGILMSLSIGQEYVFNWFGWKMLREHSNFTGTFNFCMSTDFLNKMVPRNETNGRKAGDVVQTEASLLSLATTLLSQLPSVFATLVYGPLTDRVGRKPMMLLTGSAGALSGLLFTLAVYLNWSIYWFIPLTMIVSLAGGIPGVLTVVYAYVADVSSTKWLTLRLGIVESMLFFGSAISLALGGVWLERSNCEFVAPYAVYCISNVLILLYVLFLLPESLTRSQRKAKFSTSTGLRHIARSFKIYFTRNEYSRWRLWCAVCSMFIIYLVYTGAAEISTLFLLHAPLKWTPGAIGIFQAMSQLSYALAMFLLIPLFVYLRLPDPLILLIGVVLGTLCYLLTGFVRRGWEMYAVGVAQGVASIVGPPIRSTIFKAVALEDQGAALSVLSSVEVLAAACASIIFFFFYPLTLSVGLPAGTSYLLMAGINLLQVPLTIVLLVFHKRPGGVYKVQKSISEREAAAKREQRTEIKKTEDEEEEEKETNPLLRHKRIGDSPYGAASIQAS